MYRDEELRAARIELISQEVEKQRDALEEQIVEERGALTARDRILLDTWCGVERVRLEAQEHLDRVGLRETYYNGRQHVERENKSFAQLAKAATTSARLLAALLPAKRTAPAEEADADDGVDSLDDY